VERKLFSTHDLSRTPSARGQGTIACAVQGKRGKNIPVLQRVVIDIENAAENGRKGFVGPVVVEQGVGQDVISMLETLLDLGRCGLSRTKKNKQKIAQINPRTHAHLREAVRGTRDIIDCSSISVYGLHTYSYMSAS
jgi:hypothetical protein